jgi:hypothetical protein
MGKIMNYVNTNLRKRAAKSSLFRNVFEKKYKPYAKKSTSRRANISAIIKVQKSCKGLAEKAGSPTEDAIQSWIDEIRYGEKSSMSQS